MLTEEGKRDTVIVSSGHEELGFRAIRCEAFARGVVKTASRLGPGEPRKPEAYEG